MNLLTGPKIGSAPLQSVSSVAVNRMTNTIFVSDTVGRTVYGFPYSIIEGELVLSPARIAARRIIEGELVLSPARIAARRRAAILNFYFVDG